MVRSEKKDGLIRHFSDNGKKIRQVETGVIYDDATDVFPCRYSYEETDEDIETEMSSAEALNIIAEGYE